MVRRIVGFLLLMVMMFAVPAALEAREAQPSGEHAAATMVSDGEVHPPSEAEHAHDEHHGEAHAPALPTIIQVINGLHIGEGRTVRDTGIGYFLYKFEKQIYVIFVTAIMAWLFFGALRLTAMRPGKVQVALEMLVEGLTNFFTGIVGKEHRKHVPFLCSLFLFLWVNNLTALIPGMAPMTAKYQNTLILAVMVFFYFIFYGIKDGGLGHFLWHMAGSPKDVVGWVVSPFIFFLEIVGNLAKPLSLSLRLFGNIMGEDMLLGVFLMLGILMATAVTPEPIIGVPLHLPFMFLVLLGGTIQALVFTLLTAIYIAMVLPHHEHEHEHVHGDDEHPLLPGAEEHNEKSLHVDAGAAPFVG